MIVTVNLAKGVIAMSRKKVIVKRLNAILLGARDVLCTDKTGTLTRGLHYIEAPPRHIWRRLLDRVLEYAYLNSHFHRASETFSMSQCSSTPNWRTLCVPATGSRRSTRSPSILSAGGCPSSSNSTMDSIDPQRRRRGAIFDLEPL